MTTAPSALLNHLYHIDLQTIVIFFTVLCDAIIIIIDNYHQTHIANDVNTR